MRLNAFTLLELLVALALSAVLMSMAYLALHLVQRQAAGAGRNLTEVVQTSTLQGLLTRDFRRAHAVRAQGGGRFVCQQASQEIEYELLDSCVVRWQLGTADSFPVHVLTHRFWFKALPLAGAAGPVDELELTVAGARDTLVLHAAAWYDAQFLLQPTTSTSTSLLP